MQGLFPKMIEFYNGNKIPQIGFGTYQLQGDDCLNSLKFAIDIGYRHIDSASVYRNGIQIREVIKNINIPREQFFITSKIAPTEQGYHQTIEACKKILNDLGTNYVDLLLIHWPGVSKKKQESQENATIRLETYKALEELKNQGYVKDIGVSNFLKRHLEHLLSNCQIKPVANQIEIHPLGWDSDTIQFCTDNQIVLQAYSPLARNDLKLTNNDLLNELSKKYQKSIAQISLKWAMERNFVILPKSKTELYIRENFQLFDFNLAMEEVKQIDKLNIGYHTCWDPQVIKY